MTRKVIDTKQKNKESNKKKEIDTKTKRKKIVESSSDNDSDDSSYVTESESENDNSSSSDNSKMDNVEYTKFISKMFPSKYMNNKVKQQEKEKEKDKDKKVSKDKKKINKKEKQESASESEFESSSSYEEDDDISNNSKLKNKLGNVNIFVTVDDEGEWEDDEDDSEYDEDEESEEEDEDVSVSSDDDEEDDEDENVSLEISESGINNTKEENDKLLQSLIELQGKNKNNKMINDCIAKCKEKINKLTKKQQRKELKQKDKNKRIFKKMVLNKRFTNETVYFNKLPLSEQKVIIKELREVNKVISVEKPYRISLLESSIPVTFKGLAMKKINLLKSMDPSFSEYYKIKHWVDSFMNIPFGKYNNLSISRNDGIESSHLFMENAKNTLDSAVYGLNDAKMQIMQMLGQFITNPNSIGCAIAIHGPPGTGKTTLVKEGISKILNRPFAFIALGGATDSSFLEGHSYTYEGSIWGKIVQILMDSKCMNPVIYFDELDKISDTPKGEEIAGILTHLTDTSQNSQFHDKYFSEIDFDLSKCLFIFSYNDESKVNPILKDRMYRIQTKGYDKKQKLIIANDHLLPKICDQVRFDKGEIILSDDVIHYIIENYCNKEDGVRNQKRCLEIIYTKLNLYRLMKPGSNLFDQDMSMEVKFPFQVTRQIVDKLIKMDKDSTHFRSLYV